MRKFDILAAFFPLLFLLAAGCAGLPEQAGEEEAPLGRSPGTEESSVSPLIWQPVEEINTYSDGTVDKVRFWNYDDRGNPLEFVETDSWGSESYRRNWSYADEKLASMVLFSSGKPVFTVFYELDSQDRLVKEVKKDPKEEKILSHILYTYDDKGQLRESTVLDSFSTPLMTTKNTYKGELLVKVEFLLPDGTLDGYTEKSYKKGKLTKERTYLRDGSLAKGVDYEYKDNRIFREKYFVGSRLDKMRILSYDDKGLVISESWLDAVGQVYERIQRTFISFASEREG